jgi:two-component system nitrogen regulation sensor histidine kinase NtrY
MTTLIKRRIIILIISLLSLFTISWLELYLQRSHHLIGAGINRASLFLLINIHVAAIIVLLFLIIRQSIKLFVERNQEAPGSIFKRNLLFAFILFSVIPSLFVFFTAGKFITKSIDYWFSARIHTGLDNSLKLHEAHTSAVRKILAAQGEELAAHVTNGKTLATSNFPLTTTYLWDTTSAKLYGALEDEVRVWRTYRKLNDRTMRSLKIRFYKRLEALQDHAELFDFYGSLYWAKKIGTQVIVLVHRYPESQRIPLIEIQTSRIDYEHLKSMRNPIYLSYLFSFILITLLILFLSIWCAFYLARSISKPLQELLEATAKIRKGMWGIQVSDQPDNDLHNLIVEFNNMTSALKLARQQLEHKNNELMMILENITSSVFLINRFGRILTFNSASKNLMSRTLGITRFKYKKVSVIPRDLHASLFALAKELLHNNSQQIAREIYPTINGESRIFLVQLTRLTLHDALDTKHESGLLVVVEDLTNIVKESQMKTWQTAARQMAHEIKNPLTPIQLATQRLQRKYRDILAYDPAFIGCTNTILNQVKIIKDLASHFSEFASMPDPHIEAVNINAIINELICLYHVSYPDIEFVLTLHEPVPIIKSDAKKLKRVFVNLLDNSVRALQPIAQKRILITTAPDNELGKLAINFSDNGPGMPTSVREQLFMPHVSTQKKNMGLGLAIIHDIITHQLQGSIELTPKESGTTFNILLPL